VIADAIRDGGFPPLVLDPIDFGALYMQRAAQHQAEALGGQASLQTGDA
jgi:preprotein translocase subunit SecB